METLGAIIMVGSGIIGAITWLYTRMKKLFADLKGFIYTAVDDRTKPLEAQVTEVQRQNEAALEKVTSIDDHLRRLNGSVGKLQESDVEHVREISYMKGRLDEKDKASGGGA